MRPRRTGPTRPLLAGLALLLTTGPASAAAVEEQASSSASVTWDGEVATARTVNRTFRVLPLFEPGRPNRTLLLREEVEVTRRSDGDALDLGSADLPPGFFLSPLPVEGE
jgi:hypothetical protein